MSICRGVLHMASVSLQFGLSESSTSIVGNGTSERAPSPIAPTEQTDTWLSIVPTPAG